jgi:hypothetical protein
MKLKQNNIFFILLLLLFSCTFSSGGDAINKRINELKKKYPIPELSKDEMFADFDTLVSIMERCNPQYLIRKKTTGYDMIAEMKAQRTKIENCTNTLDFIKLLRDVLEMSLDGHCYAAGSVMWHYKYSLYKKDIKINKIKNRDFGINFHYIDDVFRKNFLQINLIYTQEKYFLKYTTTFLNSTDSMKILAGTEIVTFNKRPINEIQTNVKNRTTRWDFHNNLYYSSIIEVTYPQNSIGFIQNNSVSEYAFFNFSVIADDNMERIKQGKYQVKWLDRDSIIYITIPSMQYVESWLSQLKSELLILNKKTVKSVIIDVRGNWGGNDQVWTEVLGMIIKTNIEYPCSFLTTTDKEVLKRVKPSEKKLIPKKENQRRIFECIDNQYTFRVLEEGVDVIESHEDNLGYNGKIYLLVNEDIYSSTGSFTSLSTKVDKIETIGMQTGNILGRGTNPSVFILPNSRLIFTLHLLLDAAVITKAEDFYHDHISYPIIPSIEYYKYWYDPDRSYMIDEKSMYEHDEVFIKALEIMKKQNK